MKKIFQIIGLIALISFSFIYTEKAITVVKEYDDIMIKIKEKSEQYTKKGENAIVQDNTIIPGISFSKVDVQKSYQKMREYGYYSEDLLIFEKIEPKVSLKNNKDKYIISGNQKKKMISLLFLVENETYLSDILKILENQHIEGNFFMKENDEKIVKKITSLNHIMGVYDTDDDWLITSIKIMNNREINYCFEEYNEVLETCSKKNKYTIKTTVIKNNYLLTTKKKLQNGSILTFKINQALVDELPLILKYISSKGLTIKNLDILLEE